LTARSADDLLAQARTRIRRVEPDQLEELQAAGALVVDIRPAAQRAAEGELGFGLIVERNVLEWRFDLTGDHTLPEVTGYEQPVVVVCSEGYASSFAAASLRELGFSGAADLDGGYVAWRRWRDERPAEGVPASTR
jgi:rhodanese-related sulfurtransferase